MHDESVNSFNLTHINCDAALTLFNQFMVLRDIGGTQLLTKLNKIAVSGISEYEWKKVAIFELVKLAFTASKISEAIIKAMEKYEYPEGRGIKNIFDSFFFYI